MIFDVYSSQTIQNGNGKRKRCLESVSSMIYAMWVASETGSWILLLCCQNMLASIDTLSALAQNTAVKFYLKIDTVAAALKKAARMSSLSKTPLFLSLSYLKFKSK